MFADDSALNANTEEELQRSLDLFSTPRRRWSCHFQLRITSPEGDRANSSKKFSYLGSTISRYVQVDEVNSCVSKASTAFCINVTIKLHMYKAIVLSSLLYGAETWTIYQQHAKKLNHFHQLSKTNPRR